MDPSPDHLRVRWFAMRAACEERFPQQARLVNTLFERIDGGKVQPTDLGTLIALLTSIERMVQGPEATPAPAAASSRSAPAAAAPPSAGIRVPIDTVQALRQQWGILRLLAQREQPDLARDLDQALKRLEAGRGQGSDMALVQLGLDWAQHLGAEPRRWAEPV